MRALSGIRAAVTSSLGAWTDASRRHAGVIIAVVLCATAAVAGYTATHLGVNADDDAMFSDAMPHRVFEHRYHQIFPVLYENLVVVVDADTPERASGAAAALAERMRARPDLFQSVFLPESGFFEEHALLYMDTAELEDFADRLARFQPYLAALAEDGTLRGFAMMLARGVRAVRDGDIGAEALAPLIDRFADAARTTGGDAPSRLSWAEAVAGRDLDSRRRLILLQPTLDFADLAPARRPLDALDRIAADLRLAEQGVRIRTTGDAALAYEEMQIVEGQAAASGVASFVLVASILVFALRRFRLVAATMLTLFVGLVWTAGFAAAAIGHLNLISVAFAVLFIGLGVDFGLHFGLRYQELVARGHEHASALRETAEGVGTSLVLCAVTTAIGFLAFVPTEYAGVAELGLIASAGMVVSLVSSFTLLPALMSFGLRAGAGASGALPPGLPLPTLPVRRPRLVAAAALLLTAGAVMLLPQVRFDHNPLRVRDPSAESVQAFEDLLAKGRATPWELNALAPDRASARELARELAALPTVERAITVWDFVPEDQDEKLSIIADVALFLAPPPREGDGVPRYGVAEQVESLTGLRDELGRWRREADSAEAERVARDAHAAVQALLERLDVLLEPAGLLSDLEQRVVGSLPAQLARLNEAVTPGEVTLERLPPELVERMVSAEGIARVRILPSEDLGEPGALARFVDSVRWVTPEVQGGAVSVHEAGLAIVGALQQAFASAVLVIALMLLLIWRTVADTALVLIPLALAAILTAAAAVLIGIPFNFADVIVLPLLLGIGVDSGIHLVHRQQMMRAGEGNLLETSTARAVVFSSITTVASFGSLAFASHRGMASLGQLLTLGVSMTVLCNLMVLPALIELRQRWRGGRGGDAAEGARA